MRLVSRDRRAIEDRWRPGLKDAKLRLAFASSYIAEVERDFPSSEPPGVDGRYAYLQALRAEYGALAAYARLLRVYEEDCASGPRDVQPLSQTKTA